MQKDALDCLNVCIIANPYEAHLLHYRNSLHLADKRELFQLKLGHDLGQIILVALH